MLLSAWEHGGMPNDGRRRKGVARVCHGRTPEGGRF